MTEKVSDEMLMAFVDGELEAEAAAEVRRAIAGNPSLVQRADAFRMSRELTREAFGKVTSEPVPDRLVATLMEGHSRAGAATNRRGLFRMAVPLAASVVLATGVGGYLLGQAGAPEQIGLLGGSVLAESVGGMLSGEQRSVRIAGQEVSVTVLATYAVEGGLCRTFEATPVASEAVRGIGCSFDEGWHVDIAVALSDANGFGPAASAIAASLDAYLDALGAKGPLDPEEDALRH